MQDSQHYQKSSKEVNRMKIVLICLSLIMLSGCSLIKDEKKIPKEYEGLCEDGPYGDKKTIDLTKELNQFNSMNHKASYYFISREDGDLSNSVDLVTVRDEYYVLTNLNYTEWRLCGERGISIMSYLVENQYFDFDHFTLSILDYETLEELREIDVLKIVNENYEGYQIYNGAGFREVIERDGKYYRRVPLVERPEQLVLGKALDVAVLLIDIETGEFKLSDVAYQDYIMSSNLFSRRDPYEILREVGRINGIPLDVTYLEAWKNTEFEHVLKVKVQVENLPENNQRLYAMFPDLKGIRESVINLNKTQTIHIELDTRNFPTWQSVLQLFLEDGKEISLENWYYSSEEEYYEKRKGYDDYETELAKFKQEMKEQGY